MGAFVQPLLYLLGMGLGVGVARRRGTDAPQLLDGLTYFQFLAPALIATSAMMVTTSEAMFPVHAGFKWIRTYHAAAATPLTPGQIAAGRGPVAGDQGADHRHRCGPGVAVVRRDPNHGSAVGCGVRRLDRRRLRGPDHGVGGDPSAGAVVSRDQPLRHHAAVLVRRRVLSDRPVADMAAMGGQGDADLAWRRVVPRRGHAPACSSTAPSCMSGICCCSSWAAG